MESSLTLVFMLAAAVSVSVTLGSVQQRTFSNQPSLKDLLFTNHLIFTSLAPSLLECSALCSATGCCAAFSFYPRDLSCRGHRSRLLSQGQGQIAEGARTFLMNETDGVDKSGGISLSLLSRGKTASQGSNYRSYNWLAHMAVDGEYATNLMSSSCTHTGGGVNNNWWRVDLGAQYYIYSVGITNRGDCCSERLRNFDITVCKILENCAATPEQLCYHNNGPMAAAVTEELPCCNAPITGRYITIQNGDGQPLSLCEVDVFGVPLSTS